MYPASDFGVFAPVPSFNNAWRRQCYIPLYQTSAHSTSGRLVFAKFRTCPG